MTRNRCLGLGALLFASLSLSAGPAIAEEDRGTFSVIVENDRIVNTDRHYTQGIRFAWLSAADDVPDWARDVAGHMPLFAKQHALRIGYGLGQSIFTPEDTSLHALIPEDRPYAGWLYVSFALIADTGERLDSFVLDLGMVGSAALGQDVQNNFHDLIGVARSNGWDNQLDNEPGLVLYYERKWRKLKEFSTGGWGVDITPHVGGSVGNVFTYLAGGVAVRFGQDLPSDYGPPRIRPSLPGSSFFVPQDGFGWYVFAGAEGRLIARNIFLDGNTFSSSHDVSKRVPVSDFQVGVALTFNFLRITYSHVFRTREFRGQSQADQFGAISLSVKL
ncbi:MAG: lipid A deacylase LpxR family protein [Alphaproteobacteria bacterium]|nr:lipid A deacylase LpxR family protein [Alphaproteobacteria bacterium]